MPRAFDLSDFRAESAGASRLWRDRGMFPELGGSRASFHLPGIGALGVAGEWNGWNADVDPLQRDPDTGDFVGFVPGALPGMAYQLEGVNSAGIRVRVPDVMERQVDTAGMSVVDASTHRWRDQGYVGQRAFSASNSQSMRVYEFNPAAWHPELRSFVDLSAPLRKHVTQMGFSHVLLRNVLVSHTSVGDRPHLFNSAARFGVPDDLRRFIDECHQDELGVLLDWPLAGYLLALGRGERELPDLLLASADFWIEEFHVDGLFVADLAAVIHQSATTSIVPETRSVADADGRMVEIIRGLTSTLNHLHPGVFFVVGDSSAWPGITAPVSQGGLGFSHKLNVSWCNDAVLYFGTAPESRPGVHNLIAGGSRNVFAERHLLALTGSDRDGSSLFDAMHGDELIRAANLRALLAIAWAWPGELLISAGNEFGATRKGGDAHVPWQQLNDPKQRGVVELVRVMNRIALIADPISSSDDFSDSFEWLEEDGSQRSTLVFLRWSPTRNQALVCVANLSSMTIFKHPIPLPWTGAWSLMLNTDSPAFGGLAALRSTTLVPQEIAGRTHRLSGFIDIPPRTVLWFASGR